MISGLTCKYLIHFEFIFIYGVRKSSSSMLLHPADQFSQHHLLKRLPFPHFIFLPPLLLTVCAWVYFWAFYSVPLIYVSVLVSVTYCFDYYSFVVV